MDLCPVTLREARFFVGANHRHHRAPQGGLFAVAVVDAGAIVGVAIIGKPVARMLVDGYTAEVTRLCVRDEAPKNACSMLYGAAWRACRALGYQRLVTYTLPEEGGASLRGAGWKLIGEAGGLMVEAREATGGHPPDAREVPMGASGMSEVGDV